MTAQMLELSAVPTVRTAVLTIAVPLLTFAYAEGPDAALSGVPGELGTCTACHSGRVKLRFLLAWYRRITGWWIITRFC